VPLSNQTVLQGRSASFQALVDGDGPYTYQWFRNGVAIPGAGNWKYRTGGLKFPGDNGAQYSVTVSSPSGSISSTGTVSVVADASDVWVTSSGASASDGRVYRIPAAGGTAVLVAKNLYSPGSLTIDAGHVYWAQANTSGNSDGKILMIVK